MLLDQTLHLFTQRIYKTELSFEPWGGQRLFLFAGEGEAQEDN